MPTVYYGARALKRKLSGLLHGRSTFKRCYGEHSLKLHIRDPIAQNWYDRDRTSLPEIDVLRKHGLHAGALVLDLGAHQNVVAMVMAKEVKLEGRVIAVEGSKHNVNIGRLNAKLNGITNLTTIHAIVAAKQGRVAFSQSYNGSVISTEKIPALQFVPAVTIDILAQEYGVPDIVFVDIEGYETSCTRAASDADRSHVAITFR